MKHMIASRLAAIAAVFTVFVVAAAPASAAPVSAISSNPFVAGFAGRIQITSADPSGNPMTAAYSGRGAGTTLGLGVMEGVISVQGPAPSCGAAGGFTAQHNDTLTAADGSKLFVLVQEVACQTQPNAFHCRGSYTITGGTGRFKQATGSGTFDGVVKFNPDGSGTFAATYFGPLSGVGAH